MKKYQWLWMTLLYLLLCCADGGLTYIHTPDLSLEGNPLVTHLGLGWGALFIANVLGLAVVAVSLWWACHYQLPLIRADGFWDYDAKLFYGENAKKIWLLYKLPKNWKAVGAWFGFALTPSLIIARIIVVLEWLSEDWWDWYLALRRMIWRTDVWAGILTFILFSMVWLWKSYRQNQRRLDSQNQFSEMD